MSTTQSAPVRGPVWDVFIYVVDDTRKDGIRQISFKDLEAPDREQALKLAEEKAAQEGHKIAPPQHPERLGRFAVQLGTSHHNPLRVSFHQWEKEQGLNLDCSSSTGYCVSGNSMMQYEKATGKKGKAYWHWEDEIATPALVAAGYKVAWWVDGERDSFGPLSRTCDASKDGVYYEFWYG